MIYELKQHGSSGGGGGVTDHGALTGLSDDDHSQYALLVGRSSGQSLRGGTGASETLVLESTSNATKGMVILNPTGGNVGIGVTSTNFTLDILKNSTAVSAAAGFPAFRVGNTNPTPGDGVTTHNFAAFFIECANATVRGGMRVGSNTGGSQAGDSVRIGSVSAHVLIIITSNTERARIDTSGNMGIGTTTPSTRLHVEGPVRMGQYTVAGAPSASVSGAGTMIYVSDESGGAVMAFSDGTNWRRVTDRAIIS